MKSSSLNQELKKQKDPMEGGDPSVFHNPDLSILIWVRMLGSN